MEFLVFYVEWVGDQLTISKDGISTSATVPRFELGKWFFIEIGSSSSAYYASLQFKNGTPYTVTNPSLGYFISADHSFSYPFGEFYDNYYVSAK